MHGPWRMGALLLVAIVGSACGSAAGAPRPSATDSTTPSITPSATPSPSPTPACPDRVLALMTQDQRIGQLFELGLANDRLGATEISLIRSDHIGSVWFVDRSYAGVAGIRAVSSAVQAQVSSATTANVRFFIAANQEGGLIQAMQGAGFSTIPSAVVQGSWTPSVLQSRAKVWGAELLAAGINLNFAPVLDVVPPGTDAQNEPIGVLKRGYGHDPTTVSTHGMAFLRGMAAAGITTTAKHFPGLGRVKGNTDFTAAVVDDSTTIDDAYLAPFRDAIAAAVPFVMVALAT